ncbi:branched-chain amino acid ABC transporter substrate-binding protein [Neisseriaceae bacterium TC5R-5]|nr:branched-chain amino acid ABC transporter substrate-binding protein [Neisseriaceae bacterium TC5R-5]
MKLPLSLMMMSVLALTACNKAEQTKTTTTAGADNGAVVVKIGSANPLSGPFAHWGHDSDNGVKLAVMEANTEKLTLDGKPVRFEVVSEDDQADPKTATQVAQRLVDAKVAGVIGHLTSGAAIPASRIYSEAGIPMVAASVTSPSFTKQGYNNTFRLIANDEQQGVALAKYAVETLKAKRIAIIDDRTTYGQGLADDFARAVTAAGGKVVKREFTNNNATDFMAILTSIKNEKPDLLFYGGMDAQAGPMVKQMNKLGIQAMFMGADGINTPEFAKLGGSSAEGAYASSAGMPKEKLPGYADFSKRFKQEFQKDIQAYAPYTYDATKVMIDAMKRAGSADPAKYLPELAKTDKQGVTGKIAFDSKGDIKDGTVALYRLKNGQWASL